MLLADHQEIVGEKAFRAVEELNQTRVSSFSGLKCFQDSISVNKTISSFYKQDKLNST
jgi:hypothetical protein